MLFTVPCFAQPPLASEAANNDAAAQSSGIEDIVVTASRREERLQTVPISVTALSGDTLRSAGVNATSQLAQVTPGLLFVRNSTLAQFTIRGVSARAFSAGDESNIALYVDGVYQASPIANAFDLIEISRIEVLRGPQGTLFGRNSTGGLINIITPDPSFDPRGTFEASYGNFDTLQLRGYITAPLSEKVAFDLTGNYYDDEGVVRDLVGGGRLGARTTKSARGKLLFEPSDDAWIVLTGGFVDSEDASSIIYQPINRNTVGVRVPGTIIATRPNTAALSFAPFNNVQQVDASLRSSLRLGSVALETTSSFQRNKTHNLTDNDASPVNAQVLDSRQKDTNYTQEVRLLSTDEGRFKWTAGVFGYHSISGYRPLLVTSNGATALRHFSRNRTDSIAGYAEGTLSLAESLNVTLGGRYSWEQRRYQYNGQQGATMYVSPGTLKASYTLFTPRASVQYVFSPQLNVYGTYSRGAKSGLFNTASPLNTPVAPEKLDAFEIGLKSDPARWLRFNASAFYYKYNDIQLTQRDPLGVSRLANAGKATTYGGEAELALQPVAELNLRVGASYLHTNIDRYLNAVFTVPNPPALGGNVNRTGDLSGNELVRSPKFTLSVGADWKHETTFGAIGASSNIFYSSSFWFNYSNRLGQKEYALLNGQLWVEPTDRLRLTLYGENLTNAKVRQNAIDPATADFATYVRPRSYGVRARVTY